MEAISFTRNDNKEVSLNHRVVTDDVHPHPEVVDYKDTCIAGEDDHVAPTNVTFVHALAIFPPDEKKIKAGVVNVIGKEVTKADYTIAV